MVNTTDGLMDVDEIYRLVNWTLFSGSRLRRLAMFAGYGDSMEVVQECVLAAIENIKKTETSGLQRSTVVVNATRWKLSDLVRKRTTRESNHYRFTQLRFSEYETLEPAEEKLELREILDGIISSLTHREREIIRLRFGVWDGDSRTLEETGRVFRITIERTRQIELKAMRKICGSRDLGKLKSAM